MQTNNKKDLATQSSITLFSMFRKSWVEIMMITLQKKKKRSFPLMVSSVNVTKPAVSCGFGQITEEILNGKLH